MSDTTVNLEMPYILPSQAQKHVTHNEALQRLDAAVQLTISATLSAPPPAPDEGGCFAVAASATGEWAGRGGRIAMRQDGAWLYLTPRAGWRAWDLENERLLVHDGAGWNPLPLPANAACQTLGVSAAADTGNRLAVSSPATLLTHAGGSHRLKINKAAAADTASLLFQSGWTGFAEMGLNGGNEFSVKVSDGAAWATALSISPAGIVHRPLNPVFRAWCNPGTITPAAGSQTGFHQIANLRGAATLGGALAVGQSLVVPAAGLYLLLLQLVVASSSGHEVTLLANGTTPLAVCKGGNSGTIVVTSTLTAVALLSEGDSLSLSYAGNAGLECGTNKTTLTGMLL